MREAQIDALVSKNSGGAQTYAKIEAARHLSIEVVMIAPPRREDVPLVHDVEAAVAFSWESAAMTKAFSLANLAVIASEAKQSRVAGRLWILRRYAPRDDGVVRREGERFA